MAVRRRHRTLVLTAVSVITALVVVMQSGSSTVAADPTVTTAKAAVVLPPLVPAAVSITPRTGAQDVRPADEVVVRATSGTLAEVRMTNEQGREVAGRMAEDRRAWWPAEPLGYGRDYTVSVTGRGTNATTATQTSTFSTVVPEKQMDAVTAVSGSGPAYVFLLAEAMQQAGEAQGLSAQAARALVRQTLLGAATMLTDSEEPAQVLRARVTSPGGTTQAAIESFEAGGFRDLVDRAIAAATRRGRELSAANE